MEKKEQTASNQLSQFIVPLIILIAVVALVFVTTNNQSSTSEPTSTTETDTSQTAEAGAETEVASSETTAGSERAEPTANTEANNNEEASDPASCAPSRLRAGWDETDFCNNSVDFGEVLPVLGRDQIPAITGPEMDSIDAAGEWLNPNSPVIAIEINGDARAYPQAILMFHEIANDVVGDVPVAVTFCPLCNSSIVFDRRVGDELLEFGVSGNLRNSDLIMYDRQTFSWWQQFTGEAIVGNYNETLLTIIPSQVIGFGQFVERYPQGQVMSPGNRDYGRNAYPGLDSNNNPVTQLYIGEYDERVDARERVLAGVIDEQPMAYPFEVLGEEIAINDTIGSQNVVAFWQPGVASALDQSVIDASRDIGTAALYNREVNGQVLTFSFENEQLVDAETGSVWNLFGEAVEGQLAGEQLQQLVAAPHFWFAWAAFHPETEVYGLE